MNITLPGDDCDISERIRHYPRRYETCDEHLHKLMKIKTICMKESDINGARLVQREASNYMRERLDTDGVIGFLPNEDFVEVLVFDLKSNENYYAFSVDESGDICIETQSQ